MLNHLYVHIPFCHRICPYCSFHKHTPGSTDIGRFVDALIREYEILSEKHALDLTTIYFGGGTPSMLSRTHLEKLIRALPTGELEEFTLEANPASFEIEKAKLLRDLGVTRVSLGVQSFDPSTLATLGRDHAPEDAKTAFAILREADIPSVNIDLMFAIPGQSLETWLDTLQRTIALNPDHVSAYNLNYEEDTEFFEKLTAGEYSQDPDDDAEFFHRASEILETAGFAHYEISNYAKPGHESIHNRAYWRGADYLGIGPSAVSTIARHRWKNIPDTELYMKLIDGERPSAAAQETETLDDEAVRTERVALLLRTSEGVPASYLGDTDDSAAPLLNAGLIDHSNDVLTLTKKGMPLADEIAAHLLS